MPTIRIGREEAERMEALRREARIAALRRQHRYEDEVAAEADAVEAAHAERLQRPAPDPITARLEAVEERNRLLTTRPLAGESVSPDSP